MSDDGGPDAAGRHISPTSHPGQRSTLERWGRASWFLIGIVGVTVIAHAAFSAISGLIVPLVIAVVIGTLAVPLVDMLERRGIPRSLAALLVMVAITAVLAGSIWLAIAGLWEESDEIKVFLIAGLDSIDEWLEGLSVDLGGAEDRIDQAKQFGINLIPGFASWFSSVFSSVIAFLAGTVMAAFFLYYMLVDWTRLRDWVGRHLIVDDELGAGIVEDAVSTVRQGFAALTASSAVTAVLIGATMLILDLPLAFAVALVTFVTSYIPYLGAIFSGAFACLVALGAGEPTKALILLIVILVVQNLVQTVVGNKLVSDRLSLHPIVGLMSTIVGASVAGLLGATLSAPVVATAMRINHRIKARSSADDRAAT